jgi:hypothetical protein
MHLLCVVLCPIGSPILLMFLQHYLLLVVCVLSHTNYYYVQPPMSHRIDLISILNDCCCVYCGLLHVVLVLGVWCLLQSARFLNYKKQIMSKKHQWN